MGDFYSTFITVQYLDLGLAYSQLKIKRAGGIWYLSTAPSFPKEKVRLVCKTHQSTDFHKFLISLIQTSIFFFRPDTKVASPQFNGSVFEYLPLTRAHLLKSTCTFSTKPFQAILFLLSFTCLITQNFTTHTIYTVWNRHYW